MPAKRSAPPSDSPFGRLNRVYQQSFDDDAGRNLDALAAIVELRDDLAQAEDEAAITAKRNGATWQQIADALGVSRQHAHRRWGRIVGFAGYPDK